MTFDRAATKRITRAVQTAKEALSAPPEISSIRLKRFHRAMDALVGAEGEEVYRILSKEPGYARARKLAAKERVL